MDKGTVLTLFTISVLESISNRQALLIEQRNKDIEVHNSLVDKLNDDIANHRHNITYLDGAIKHLSDLKEDISGLLSAKLKEFSEGEDGDN